MSLDRPSLKTTRCLGFLLVSLWLTTCVFDSASSAFAFQNAPNEPMPAAGQQAAPAGDLPVQKTFLQWLIDASGPFGACVFIESFIMVLIIMCLLQMRRSVFMPPNSCRSSKASSRHTTFKERTTGRRKTSRCWPV